MRLRLVCSIPLSAFRMSNPLAATAGLEIDESECAADKRDGAKEGQLSDDSAFPNGPNGLDAQSAKKEKLKLRLEAEASIGVSAALIGGFALSLIPEASGMPDLTQWIFVMSMALTGSLCLFTLIVTGSVFWAGHHLLSASKATIKQENDLFRDFWTLRELRFARWACRAAYEFSIPVFLGGAAALVQGTTQKGWLTFSVMVVFSTLVLMTMPILRRINHHTTTTTATA